MKHERLVLLDGAVNFRDIGGYRSQDGRKVKWHKIYRSDSLTQLSALDQEKLAQLHITIDCDLRSELEAKFHPDASWPNRKLVFTPLYDEQNNDSDMHFRLQQLLHKIPQISDYLGSIYQRVLLNKHSQEMIAAIFKQLLHLPADAALVYHCSAGKDRTGIMTAMILLALNVDEVTIIKDYLLTNRLYDFSWQHQHPSTDQLSKMIAQMNVTRGEGLAIQGITQTITAGWGNFANFFVKELGFNKNDLIRLQQMYLEA